MPWDFTNDRSIYIQLVELLAMKIISGEYPLGSRLPTVRELAAEASVNPNTMQKAFCELERLGLVYSQRTSGRFITQDTGAINQTKNEFAKNQVKTFLEKMKSLGLTQGQIIELINKFQKEEH